MPENGEQQPSGQPDYKVYRSRRGIFSRFRGPDLGGLGEGEKGSSKGPGGGRWRLRRSRSERGARPARPGRRRALKWVGLAALGWIVLSFLAFAISAQIQAFKLSGEAKSALHGNPLLLPKAQTILLIGTDARPPDTKGTGAPT